MQPVPEPAPGRRSRRARVGAALVLLAIAYLCLAYLLLPFAWSHYEHQRRLAGLPMTTLTAQGIPGDPLNVGLVGEETVIVCAMHEAGWVPADPVTLATSLRIIGSVVLDRPYPRAPVSALYYDGRKEDLAFQKPVGHSADQREHARFWKALESGDEGRPVWLGAATFDEGVGLSRYTGAVTHKIAPDIDAERDRLVEDLKAAHAVTATYRVTGVGPTLYGRNGGGFRYFTDGEILLARLVGACGERSDTVAVLADPPIVDLKSTILHGLTRTFGDGGRPAEQK
jgi:hypothetical protein